jgi:glycosyltransferase involved in cell wall biosynthesis
MRVVIAHDYLTQRGGAERVVLEIARAYPGATILTSMYIPERTFSDFQHLQVESLGLERSGAIAKDPRRALPLLGPAFRRKVVEADLLLCSSTGFAHQLRSNGPKIVYCHNPPRWLYQWSEYSMGLGAAEKLAFRVLRRNLMRGDVAGARSSTGYIANSANVSRRVISAYGITPAVVHPPRGLDPDGAVEPVDGLEPGFLLTVGRPRGYKRTNLLMEAVAGMPDQRLVAVGAASERRWPANIVPLSNLSDAQLRWLYMSARALLACSYEDFGLTPVEAFAFGLPVGATREGGYLETCVDGETGSWLDGTSPAGLQASIRRLLEQEWDTDAIKQHGERWAPSTFRTNLREAVQRLAG